MSSNRLNEHIFARRRVHTTFSDAQARPSLKVAVITISDRASRGEYEDATGPAVRRAVATGGPGWSAELLPGVVVADDTNAISAAVLTAAAEADVVLTAGGTGWTARDVTPEAVAPLLTRTGPGIVHMLLARAAEKGVAALTRPVAGQVSSGAFVVTLPGSPQGAVEMVAAISGVLPHLCDVTRSNHVGITSAT
jgi:molybdenum cofactor synthesis domain-containing protein